MQDRQHRTIGYGIEQPGRLPCGRQGPSFRLTVTHHAGHDQVGIIEHRSKRVTERVAELPTLVNRSGRCRRHVAGDSARKRELLEQLLEAGFILRYVWINFAPCPFEVNAAHDCRTAVTGTGDVEHFEVILLDHPIQVHIDDVLPGCRTPVPDH